MSERELMACGPLVIRTVERLARIWPLAPRATRPGRETLR
jgi:hypothetical protein